VDGFASGAHLRRGRLVVAVATFDERGCVLVRSADLSTAHIAAISGPNPTEWSMTKHGPHGTPPPGMALCGVASSLERILRLDHTMPSIQLYWEGDLAMGRRAAGEGTIYRRKDGRWEAAVILGGHRYRLYGQTRESVSRQLVTALRAHQEGQLPLGSRELFGRFWSVWLPSIRSNLRPRTWTRYEELGRIHLLPLLGTTRIGDLSVQNVQALHGRMLRMGTSPSTVHHAHAVLHRALADAVRWGVVSRNVAGLVPPPRMAIHEIQTLTGTQARELCRAAAGTRFEALYVLAVSTGMRQGELLALRWSGVDLDRGLVQVTGTMTRTEAGLSIAPPKTARSRRSVALADQAIEALIRHRERQQQEKELLGEAWVDEDLVFPNTIGGPMQRDHLVKRDFVPLLQRAGLPAIRFHDLRHTAATLLLSEGVHPKVASEMLGHATVAITLDRYSHVTATMQRAAAQSMSELLRGTPSRADFGPGSG